MANQSNHRSGQATGNVQIRLTDLQNVATRRSAHKEDALMQEITISLTRLNKEQVAQPVPPQGEASEQSSWASLARFFAQISLLAITVFIGVTFGGLVCLAFILFFCLPVAVHHWSEPDDMASRPEKAAR